MIFSTGFFLWLVEPYKSRHFSRFISWGIQMLDCDQSNQRSLNLLVSEPIIRRPLIYIHETKSQMIDLFAKHTLWLDMPCWNYTVKLKYQSFYQASVTTEH